MSPTSSRTIRSADDLRDHVLEAYEAGQRIDLDDVVYGPATDGGGYRDETMSYYPLLAGHAAITGASTIIEIGTHYGGSTLALLAGMRAGAATDPVLLTMDVTELNVDRLAQEPEITRLTGDSTEPGFVRSLAMLLPSPRPDLLYIDALKDAGYVLRTLHNVARAGIAPSWLILDDIQATDSMRALWDVLEAAEPDRAFLVSRDFPHIRNPKYGYAIVHLAGTADLLARCVELMERLGLDTTGMTATDNSFDRVRSEEQGADYHQLHPDAPTLGSTKRELSILNDLARTHVRGHGEVVDFGCTVGTTTRALAAGLADNPATGERQRVHAYDSFVRDHPSLDKIIGDHVEPGGSLRPEFDGALGGHVANVYPIEPHVGRWFGAPIELFVAGAIRTPRTSAHVIAEFSPHFLAGTTVLAYREGLALQRPWVALTIAYLRDHFELLRVSRSLTVHGFTRPVPAHMVTRLVEDRFSATERVDLIRGYADSLTTPGHRWGFLAQAGAIAIRLNLLSQAVEIEAELRSMGTGGDSIRERRLLALQGRIETATAEMREEAR